MIVAKREAGQADQASRTTPVEWASGWPQSPPEFEAFIDAFQDRLVRYAYCKLKDLGDAEDVVQDVFLKAYARRRELSEVRDVAPYLHRMVANLCIDRLRRPRPDVVPIDGIRGHEIPRIDPEAAQRAEAAEQITRAEALIARLPERQADVLRLRVFDDLTLEEIAATLRCPLSTVKSRLRYGLARLRRFLPRGKERTR